MHTKGPWTYRPDIVNKGFYIETEDMSHENTFIGDVGGGLQSKPEIEANARLISKAPQLLRFLKRAVALYVPDGTEFCNDAINLVSEIEK